MVTFELDGPIGTLWLDAPPRNQMTLSLFDALEHTVHRALDTPSLAGIVVRGRGRHFSAGADVEELSRHLAQEEAASIRTTMRRHGALLEALENAPIPIVAAIDGCCLGSALELALACHVRIATRSALLGFPEASFGLMPGQGGILRAVRLLGRARALELALTARSLDAEEARGLGLIDLLVERSPGDALGVAAKRVAGRLGPKGP